MVEKIWQKLMYIFTKFITAWHGDIMVGYPAPIKLSIVCEAKLWISEAYYPIAITGCKINNYHVRRLYSVISIKGPWKSIVEFLSSKFGVICKFIIV